MRTMFALSAALLLSVSSICAAENGCEFYEGGIVRGPRSEKKIALEFSADQFVEGGPTILDALAAHHAKASFFLTGRSARHAGNKKLIQRMIADGHYVGPHSNSHPLLCPWTGKKRTLVTKDFFIDDLKQNLVALEQAGVQRQQIKFFLPPYEWYNNEIANWTREAGLQLINLTRGTRSPADYTEERARNFVSSHVIMESILGEEKQHGLNGFLLLMHLGAGPERKDKMYRHVSDLLDMLQKRGYQFVRVDELLANCATASARTALPHNATEPSKTAAIFLPPVISANN